RCAAGSLANTQASRLFRSIAGTKYALHQLKEKEMRDLYPVFRDHLDAVFYYVRHVVVKQLEIYDKMLISTPQNLRSMFASSLSMSATPQDAAAHGPDTV